VRIARTFQNIRLFGSLNVFDNVRVAFRLHLKHGIRDALLRGKTFLAEEKAIDEQVMEMLAIFNLEKFRDVPAKSLPYGDQRRLEIVRALATKPKLLCLDEPAAGMNPTEKVELMKLIRFIEEKYKISVLLVEHDMKVVMGLPKDLCAGSRLQNRRRHTRASAENQSYRSLFGRRVRRYDPLN